LRGSREGGTGVELGVWVKMETDEEYVYNLYLGTGLISAELIKMVNS
jgi:hypothetical protein